MSNELPYSVRRVSDASGVPRRTVLNHIDSGELRAVKLGDLTSAWVIPAEEAIAYIEKHRARREAAAS